MTRPYCFHCRYFVPEGMDHNELPDGDVDETIAGECRRHTPVPGAQEDDPRRVNYAYWPAVIATQWCGEFERCNRHKTPCEPDQPKG